MSYNGYTNHSYSPYFQSSTGQDGRSQYGDQSRAGSVYQNSSYQPLSAYHGSQPPQASTAQSSNAGTAYNHPGYGRGDIHGGQDSRVGYDDGRSSVDTSALGNLAYASSLGRDSSNMQQAMSYNRAPNSASYPATFGVNSASTTQYGVAHQRTDSSGVAQTSRENGSRAPPATSSPSFGYSTNSVNTGHQLRRPNVGQAQYTAGQSSQNSAEVYRANQYNNPSRPSSGQAVQRPPSTTGSQVVSPTVTPAQNARVHPDGNYRRDNASGSGRLEESQTSAQHQQTNSEPSTGPRAGPHTSNTQPKQSAGGSTLNAPGADIQTLSKKPPNSPSAPLGSAHTLNETQINRQIHQKSTPTNRQFPATVNPSQIFNDVEYQRRQVAAAEEVKSARKKAEQAQVTALISDRPPGIPPSASSDADVAKKEQMELEMKQMIEKMRDYKSKDPSLFSQIWEQVKKGQPTQRASPHTAAADLSTSPVVATNQEANLVHLPPESELPAAEGQSIPPDFDRGRFPAQRRRRGGTSFTPERQQRDSAKSTSTGGNADPGSQTRQRAMADYHRNSDSPMPQTQGTIQTAEPIAEPPLQQDTQSQSMPTLPSVPRPSAKSTPSAKSQTQTKPPAKAGGTYWPENKKRQLAEAARTALASSSPNIGKEITTEEIHQLLDQNPSYTQMCEILEYRGFSIDRGQFARLLLSAVPDLGSSNTAKLLAKSTPSTAPPLPPPSQSTPPAAPPRPMPHSVPPAPPPNGFVTPYSLPNPSGQYQPPQALMTPTNLDQQRQYPYSGHGLLYPHVSYPPPAPSQQPTSTIHPLKSNVKWIDKNSRPSGMIQPPPSTKQDMARKRSFGEIVDLTQALSDDEDAEPPSQRLRIDDGDTIRVYTAGQTFNSGSATPTSVKDRTPLEDFRHKPTGKEAYLQSPDIIHPMNKRQDALRRSSYNPKTIARDILIAIGKHPTMAPLNSHLDVLRERFTAVNYDSDLGTFRWDLVDPGGPPPVQNATVDEDLHSARRTSGKRARKDVAVVVGGDSPIDVKLGKIDIPKPNIESLTFYQGQSQPRKEGFKPTRGGHAAPSTRPRPAGTDAVTNPQTPKPNSTSSQSGITRTGLSDSGFSRFVYRDLPVMLNNITGDSVRTPTVLSSHSTTPASGSTKVRVPGRIGRPPGARNKNPCPDKGIPKNSTATPVLHQTSQSKGGNTGSSEEISDHARDTTPAQRHAGLARTSSNSLAKRPSISTTPVRPSSLRNAMSPSDGIAVVIPSRSPSVMEDSPVTSIRPSAIKVIPKSLTQHGSKIPPAPAYKVHKCYWDRCPAELHNLETLRKHIRKHRSDQDFKNGHVPCLWANCYDNERERERLGFRSMGDWDDHMTTKHVMEPSEDANSASGMFPSLAAGASFC